MIDGLLSLLRAALDVGIVAWLFSLINQRHKLEQIVAEYEWKETLALRENTDQASD